MKTVKFLKAKTYAGRKRMIGESIPMCEKHAELLHLLGIVVIEDSPVVKMPIPISTPVEPTPTTHIAARRAGRSDNPKSVRA